MQKNTQQKTINFIAKLATTYHVSFKGICTQKYNIDFEKKKIIT